MGVSDFISSAVVVTHDGRRYECRRPTLRTVVLAMDAFSGEIAAAGSVESEDFSASDMILAFASHDDYRERAAAILRTCTDLDSPRPDSALVVELVRGVLSTCSLDRIMDGMSGGGDSAPSSGPSPLEFAMVRFAERFGCTPESIADWSFEAYLGTLDVLNASASGEKDELPYLTAENAPPGVVVGRA